jgi:hypothetical protein
LSIAKSAAASSVATLVGTVSVRLAVEKSKVKSNDAQVVLSEVRSHARAMIGSVEDESRSVGSGSPRCWLSGNVDTPASVGSGSSSFELDGNGDATEAFGSNGNGSSRRELGGDGDPGLSHALAAIDGGVEER